MSTTVHHPRAAATAARPYKRGWLGECPGLESQIEFALRFTKWMQARRKKPTAEEMMEQWGMSRATAYRYKAAYRAVNGGDA